MNEINKKSIYILCLKESVFVKFLVLYIIFFRIYIKSIICLDIFSGGGFGVFFSIDGIMKIW